MNSYSFGLLETPFLNKTKKTITAILLVLCMLLPGCGSSGSMTAVPDDHKPAASDESEKTQEEDTGKDEASDSEAEAATEKNEKASSDKSLFNQAEGSNIQLINTFFDESRYEESERNLYFQSFGNHILCSFDMEKAYPRLAAALQKIADNEEKSMRDHIREYEKDAEDYARDMLDSGVQAYYSDYAEDILKRADDKCVSILRVANGFLGGAHPDYHFETFNISSRTGERIKLSEVVTNQNKLNEVLIKKLTADYPDVEFFDLEGFLAEYDMTIAEGTEKDGEYHYAYDFTLDPDGIAFYFSPYGISAYAYGSQTVKIKYSEEPSLFKEDYGVKGAYVSYLTDLDNKYDIGGEIQSVGIEKSEFDDNGYFTSFDVRRGDAAANSGELYAYGLRAFLAHTKDGRDYVYIIINMDNDYKGLYVADLNNSKTACGEAEGLSYTYRNYLNEESGIYGEVLPVDPESMEFAARCELLSTYNAYGRFETGEDGFPVLKGDYLTVPDSFTLTSIAEIKSDIVDEDGNVTEKDAELKKGEKLTLYRTDGNETVDATLPDGRIVRFKVSGSNYPHKVNGVIDEDKLFEGLFYSG